MRGLIDDNTDNDEHSMKTCVMRVEMSYDGAKAYQAVYRGRTERKEKVCFVSLSRR